MVLGLARSWTLELLNSWSNERACLNTSEESKDNLCFDFIDKPT